MTKTKNSVVAVSMKTQQEASLYGIAAVLVSLDGVPHRKKMKRAVKDLSKSVKKAIGVEGAKELMGQNKAAIEMPFRGIRSYPKHTPAERKRLMAMLTNDLLESYSIGIAKFYGGK